MNIFRVINYGMKAKQGYNAPDEVIADTSFSFIEGFFIVSFIILGILSSGLLYFGIALGYNLMVIAGILFLIILIVDILVYRFIKKIIQNISTKITMAMRSKITTKDTINDNN
jgi:Flp pilus assembly protein TadB